MTREIYVSIFGKGGELLLIPVPTDVRAMAVTIVNKLPFCGVMAFIDGKSYAKCEPNAEAVLTMASAVPAFVCYVAAKLKRVDTWSELT